MRDLGRIGLTVDVDADGTYLKDAVEAEELGYSGLWVAGGQLDTLAPLSELLRATRSAVVGSAIIPFDRYGTDEIAEHFRDNELRAPGRFVAGFGGLQARPVSATRQVLGDLDGSVPVGRRLLAALGPRKLDLAGEAAAGAITMLVPPEHTAQARRRLGPRARLVVLQMVTFDPDRERARRTLREPMRFLVGTEGIGYAAHLRRMGFGDDELAALSDRLVDSVAGAGDVEVIAEGVRAHLQAGADHVVLGVQSDGDQPGPIETARALAEVLL
ncbi:TIGR03620 family F420-dependent LLM class oxidoreductase [Saccharopolyspora sp. ID03-671]|uniref:TIGR03620 family F420-dependent LLM class oxidoreductase n=1 Tax=Saccharopolyspora sp. ID03-671 TaxID=3073066 RepID=UPI003251781C